ncbi:MAG: elongation factor Ts [Clostridiales bacterium]|nr:elongation factor Ts [Clostridiales bacterium]
MAEISAKAVAELRKATGCGMMECKNALKATDGNFDEAVKYLRERGLAVAAKKADRIAAEGVVDILKDGDFTAMVEVNAETDFVAKNEDFQKFVKNVLAAIIASNPADVEALKAVKIPGSEQTVGEALVEKIATIKENMSIRRFVLAKGVTSTYIHGQGQTGVIVVFDTDVADKEGFAEYAKNIALQVAGAPVPAGYTTKDEVPASVIDEEKAIIMATIKNDESNAKKPDNIIEKMAVGRLGKFFSANCLVEQEYVKDDSMTVAKYTDATAKALGGKIAIKTFYRFEKGEGLAKREDNFAAEIASMIKQ